jgi:hypothetical protein
MIAPIAFLCAFLVVAAAVTPAYKNELVLVGDEKIEEVVKSPRPVFGATELPKSLDYRPLGLLTQDLNQHIPVYW